MDTAVSGAASTRAGLGFGMGKGGVNGPRTDRGVAGGIRLRAETRRLAFFLNRFKKRS